MKKYLCGVTFQHELGETDDIGIYDSIDQLKEKSKCYVECGIVEIEFVTKPENYTAHTWILEQNFDWNKIGPNDYVDPEKDLTKDQEAKKESDQ